MTSMIERVARAICAESCENYEMLPGIHNAVARAAIEAMREPSAAMQQAVAAQWGHRTWSQYNDLIDAALKEPTT